MRRAFGRWGRPERFRVDNGVPWGSSGDLPTDLSLWLIGLGIEVIWNPPRSPQDNGVVERSQGTAKRWAEPGLFASPEELQGRLERMDVVEREAYPSVKGRSRLEAFPGLVHSGRDYTPAWEESLWDVKKVHEHLSRYAVPRRVDLSGKASLYNRYYYVGIIHKGKTAFAMLDPESGEWIFADAQGRQLRRRPACERSRENILALTETRRRNGTNEQ